LGNYRDRLDIIADILNVASRAAKKTQLMYQANLSYKVLQKYLSEITDAELVHFEDVRQCFMLTVKGQEYLDAYREYSKCNKNMEKRLNDIFIKRQVLESLCPPRQPELEN
jgi:predicted transcriptional regulator